jgi:DNA-binding CsgD family transcriptional regulator
MDPEAVAITNDLARRVNAVIDAVLTPRNAAVLRAWAEGELLRVIGDEHGISAHRVRQIVQKGRMRVLAYLFAMGAMTPEQRKDYRAEMRRNDPRNRRAARDLAAFNRYREARRMDLRGGEGATGADA